VLEISTGATNQNQGQYAFSVSGVNADQVYEAASRLGQLSQYRGSDLSWDYFSRTPNVDIGCGAIGRRTACRDPILALLRARTPDYLYLIKRPQDQYRSSWAHIPRGTPETRRCSTSIDDGKNLVPAARW
jgi:hypothetical protein